MGHKNLSLALAVLLAFSSVVSLPAMPQRAPADTGRGDGESEYSVVETAQGPALRFPVIHLHNMGRCYGHITLSAERVAYAVKYGEASHSFDRPRSELESVAKGKMGFLSLGVNFKWSSGDKQQFVPIKEKSLEDRSGFKVRAQGQDEDKLLLAGQDWPTALSQLGGQARQSSVVATGSVAPAGNSIEGAAARLASRVTQGQPSGLYALEEKISFNVVDGVYFDPAAGQFTLFGHYDAKYGAPAIPYLQHLATLLENPRPEFTLEWTQESERKVDEFMRRAESPEEARRLAREWGTMSNAATGDYRLTPQARYLMRGLNVMPTYSGSERAGYFGAEIRDTPNGFGVIVTRVDPNGPAARAGVRPGDKITQSSGAPSGGVAVTAAEFQRAVRLWGTGSEFKFVVEGRGWQGVTLTAAPGDLWSSITTNDFTPMLWRAAGKEAIAEVIEAFYRHNRMLEAGYPDMGEHSQRAYVETLFVTGLFQEFQRLQQEVQAGRLRVQDAEASLNRQTCAVLERRAGLPAGSMTGRYDQLLSRRRVSEAYYEACLAPENFLPVTLAALRTMWQKAGAIQIAPEMIDRTFNVRPEVIPQFRGVRAETLLARAMAEGDYIGKRLMDMPWLERTIPRYVTGYKFLQQHPQFDRQHGVYHMWISVARMDAVQSPDKSTLETRDAAMRFNIREYGPDGRDLPAQKGGYDELLTSLYDPLTREFPVLHELREAAKLAAIADWMRAKAPDFRLPREGMATWQPPARLPGLMYIYAHMPDPGARTATVATIATGGVALEPWVWSGKANLDPSTLPVDSQVVDLRGLKAAETSAEGLTQRTVVEVPRYPTAELARVLKRPMIEVPPPHPPGWVTPARKAERVLQTVSVLREAAGKAGCDSMQFHEKVEVLERLQRRLAETEKLINAVNARAPELYAMQEKLDADLRRDQARFQQDAFDLGSKVLFGLHHELKHGTLKETAQGVSELKEILADLEERKDLVEKLSGSPDERMAKMREITSGLVERIVRLEASVPGNAAHRYLGPVLKQLDAIAKVKKVADLAVAAAKVHIVSDWRVKKSDEQAETDLRIRNSLLPFYRNLSDHVDALRRDAMIEACLK